MNQITITDNDVSMSQLIKENTYFRLPKPGELVEGRVIARGKNHILIDINGITTGTISGKELIDGIGTNKDLKIGDLVTAFVLEEENENGMVILSFRKASHLKVWDRLRKVYEDKEIVEVVAKEANKGGLMTEIDGVVAFLPVSQLAPANFPRVNGANAEVILARLKKLIGKKFTCKIILFDEQMPKIMVSEREAFAEVRSNEIAKLKIGDVINGEVNGIVKFGIFITFGNLEGLVHVSEITWDENIKNPQNDYKMNQEVSAKVISFSDQKISLSIKRLEKDPWMDNIKKFPIGSAKEGTVNKVTDFGVFVTLAEEVTGLVHISEFEDDSKSPSEIFKEEDKIKVKILGVNQEDRSMKLSLKLKEESQK